MSKDEMSRCLDIAQVQAAMLKKGVSKGAKSPQSVLDEAIKDMPDEWLDCIPPKIVPGGRAPDDWNVYWPCSDSGELQLPMALGRNLDTIKNEGAASRRKIADNSLEASDNMIEHIAAAADAFTSGDMGAVAQNAGEAVGDFGQVWGHLSAGN